MNDPARSRIVGVDVARALALLGMMLTHLVPTVTATGVPVYQQVAIGRSSALFAVLAGLSLVLVAGRGPDRSAYAMLVTRALLIAVIGLALGELDTHLAVILTYYGLLFVVVAPLLRLSSRMLVVGALAWVVVAPVVSLLVRRHLPAPSYAVPSFGQLWGDLPALVRELLVTGYYPVLTWVPYAVAGVLVARLDLRAPRVWATLVGAGASLAVLAPAVSALLLRGDAVRERLTATYDVAGWRGDLDTTLTHGLYGVTPTGDLQWLEVAAPHSGTTFDLLATTGSALAVLGVCLAAAVLLPRLRVPFGVGAMTLSAYSLHIVMSQAGWWDRPGWSTYSAQAVALLLIGAGFALLRSRGPLEWLVARTCAGVVGARH